MRRRAASKRDNEPLLPVKWDDEPLLPELGPGERPRLHLGAGQSAGITFGWQGTEFCGCLVVTGYVDDAALKRALPAGARKTRALLSVNGLALGGQPRALVMERMTQAAELPRQLGFGGYTQGNARRERPSAPPLVDDDDDDDDASYLQPMQKTSSLRYVTREEEDYDLITAGGAHDDPFSTPTRRRRITMGLSRRRVRDYVRLGCEAAWEHRCRQLASLMIQCAWRSFEAGRVASDRRRLRRHRCARVVQAAQRRCVRRAVARGIVAEALQRLARLRSARRRRLALAAARSRRRAASAAGAVQTRRRGIAARRIVETLKGRVKAVTRVLVIELLYSTRRGFFTWVEATRVGLRVFRAVRAVHAIRRRRREARARVRRLATSQRHVEALLRTQIRERAWQRWRSRSQPRLDAHRKRVVEAALFFEKEQQQQQQLTLDDDDDDDDSSEEEEEDEDEEEVEAASPLSFKRKKQTTTPKRPRAVCVNCSTAFSPSSGKKKKKKTPPVTPLKKTFDDELVIQSATTSSVGWPMHLLSSKKSESTLLLPETKPACCLKCALAEKETRRVEAVVARVNELEHATLHIQSTLGRAKAAKRQVEEIRVVRAQERGAAVVLETRLVRGRHARRRFQRTKKGVAKIQAMARSVAAQKRVARLKTERENRIFAWAAGSREAALTVIMLPEEEEAAPLMLPDDDGTSLWLNLVKKATPPPPGCLPVDAASRLNGMLPSHALRFPSQDGDPPWKAKKKKAAISSISRSAPTKTRSSRSLLVPISNSKRRSSAADFPPSP